jgi:hypothetical protein
MIPRSLQRHGGPPDGRPAWRLSLIVGLFLVLLAGPGVAQQPVVGSLAGRVADSAGAPVVDAAVTLSGPGVAGTDRTMLSDRAGAYRFQVVQPGSYTIRVRRLGFVAFETAVTLAAGEARTLNMELVTDTLRLPGIVVEARREAERERARFENEPGVTARVVEASTIRLLPGLGESDVLRAVEMLPGVISTSDFSSSFNVRGGSTDQNLILIDGFTVFNPFHLGGLFSVFNTDAVEQAELFAGGFGAEFGGRVSSVLNIESRSDVPERLEVLGGVSLLATRLMIRSALPTGLLERVGSESGSWFISGRRSYFDQLLRPVADFPYHLTDIQTHASLQTRGGGRLSLSGYWGEDVLDLSRFGLEDGGAADVLRLRWNWGNQVLGVNWTQPLPGGWIAESRVGYSRFAEALGFVDFADVQFGSRISQVVARADLRRDFSPVLSARVGAAADAIAHRNTAEAGGTTFFGLDGTGRQGAAHGSVRWRPGRWIVEPGLRVDVWTSADDTRTVLSPRFAAKRFFGAEQELAAKLAIGRYTQFVHSLRDEDLPVSNETWIVANRDVPHIVSDQVQLGVESFWGEGWSASAEAYYRTFDGVTDFNVADDPNDPADDILAGDGHSYGLDLMLRRAEGGLTGWAALSLLRAERTYPDPLTAGWEDVPQTVTYAPIFDRRVNLDLVAQYTTARNLEIGARWNFGSGLPYTRPIAQYFGWSYDPVTGRYEPQDGGSDRNGLPVAVVLGARNTERYPAYHRLDVTLRRTFERRWGTYVPYLQVLNVYNRRNVLFYFFDYDRSPPVRSGFSMFPFLPAIGVEVTF